MIFDALAPQGIAGPDYLLMSGVVLVGALLQGVGGIGFAMFSAPLAGLFFPGLAPGPLLALGGAVSLMSASRCSAVSPAPPWRCWCCLCSRRRRSRCSMQ
jgi:hypothetical protein